MANMLNTYDQEWYESQIYIHCNVSFNEGEFSWNSLQTALSSSITWKYCNDGTWKDCNDGLGQTALLISNHFFSLMVNNYIVSKSAKFIHIHCYIFSSLSMCLNLYNTHKAPQIRTLFEPHHGERILTLHWQHVVCVSLILAHFLLTCVISCQILRFKPWWKLQRD